MSANPSRGWSDGLTGQFCRLYEPPQGMATPSNTGTLFACWTSGLSVRRHKTVTTFGLHAFGIYALLILKMDVWQPKGVRPKAPPCGQLIAVMCRCVQRKALCTYAHVGISCPSGRELQRCELDAFGCSSSMQWPHL
jgi:hypothetical protein